MIDSIRQRIHIEDTKCTISDPSQGYMILTLIMNDIRETHSILLNTLGYWRPSFSSFYEYFYWEPLKPEKPVQITLSNQSSSLFVPLSPLQQIAMNTIWKQHGIQETVTNSLHLLTISLDYSRICLNPQSFSISFSSLIVHLLRDEYPTLTLQSFTSLLFLHSSNRSLPSPPADPSGQSTQLTVSPSSSPSISPSSPSSSPSITGRMDLKKMSAGLDYLTLTLFMDHLPSIPLSSSSNPSFNIAFMVEDVCCVGKHPTGLNANLNIARLSLLLSPEWTVECIALSLHVLREDECLIVCEGSDLGISAIESLLPSDNSILTIQMKWSILDMIPSSSLLSYSSFLSFYFYLSRIDFQFEFQVAGLCFCFEHISLLSLTHFNIETLTVSLYRANLPPFHFLLVNSTSISLEDGFSILIQSIHSLLSAASLCSLYSLFNQLSSFVFRFTVERQVQNLLLSTPHSSFALPSRFSLHIHSLSLKYRALHPSANQVQRIACVCVLTNLSLSEHDISLEWIDVGVTDNETAASQLITSPFSHVSQTESISLYHPIISIPSISLTWLSSVQFSISSILGVVSSQNLAIMILILRDLQSLHVKQPLHFIVHPQDLTLHILKSTYHRLKELRWRRETVTRTASFPFIMNCPQMYRPTHFSQTDDELIGTDERQRVEALLRKMVNAMTYANRMPREVECSLHTLVLQLDDGEAECRLNDLLLHISTMESTVHADITLESLIMTASQSTMENPLSLSPFTLGTSSLESFPPILHITLNLTTGRLLTLHSVVISVAPLRLQFSIPALKSLISFFEAANYKTLPTRRFTQSPALIPIRLQYLRVNAIQVYCALTPTPQADYSLIPFTLNSITLRERICSVKHIFILLRRRLLTDLFSQTSQHVAQASAVVANAMGFSGLVSLLRKPIQLPRHLSQQRKEKEKKKLIRQFLGRKAHIINHQREDNDVLTCEEESIPGFSNPLFEALRQND